MAHEAVARGFVSRYQLFAAGSVLWARLGTLVVCLVAGVALGALVSLLNPFVGLGVAMATGLVAVALWQPTGRFWLLAGVIGLLPFGVIPIRLGFQPTLLDATLALLSLVAALRFLTKGQAGTGTPLDVPILAYLTLCTVSFVGGTAYGVTPDTLRYFVDIVLAILLYFALTNGLTKRQALRSFVDALILSSVGAGVVAVALNLAGQETAMRLLTSLGPLGYPTGQDTLRFIASTSIWRATGTSIDPNIFGGLMMVGIVLLSGRWLGREGKAGREERPGWGRAGTLLALAGLTVMIWALLLSYSRGAYVGTAVGIVYLGILRYRKLLPVMALAGVLVAITLGGSDFGRHLVSGFLVEDKAAAMRLGEYKDAVNFIQQYPFFGVGFGTTPSGTALTPAIDVYVGVSNIYLLMALEIGLVGVLGFASVVLTLATWTWRSYAGADSTGRAWIATTSAALFAAAVAGIADHYFFRFPHMVALFWSLVAIVAISARLARLGAAPKAASAT